MYGQPNHVLEESENTCEEPDLRKTAKYLRRCKDQLWSRWRAEYLKALRKRHHKIFNNSKQMTLKEGDVAISFS